MFKIIYIIIKSQVKSEKTPKGLDNVAESLGIKLSIFLVDKFQGFVILIPFRFWKFWG